MDEIIPPSSAPIAVSQDSASNEETIPINEPGQVCYERVLPSQDHYYKIPDPPKCTGNSYNNINSGATLNVC